MHKLVLVATLTMSGAAALAQSSSQEASANQGTAVQAPGSAIGRTLPANTIVVVTPLEEITSKRVEENDKVAFTVVNDVVENGTVVIRRGTPVTGLITWKTGRAVGGKSGKFEVEFKSLALHGKEVPLRGKHRQEGRGNTVGALLGSLVISGRSAVMLPGQLVNAFTAQEVSY